MNASWLDLRRRMKAILKALDRNEAVKISYRGKLRAIMYPATNTRHESQTKAADHPAVGMWSDRDDMTDVSEYVRRIRRGRVDDL
jgi:hypothetical protein